MFSIKCGGASARISGLYNFHGSAGMYNALLPQTVSSSATSGDIIRIQVNTAAGGTAAAYLANVYVLGFVL